jgi:hypothetical protein
VAGFFAQAESWVKRVSSSGTLVATSVKLDDLEDPRISAVVGMDV